MKQYLTLLTTPNLHSNVTNPYPASLAMSSDGEIGRCGHDNADV